MIAALIVLVVGLLLPAQYHSEHETKVETSKAQLFDLLTDFNNWPEWQPWQHVDKEITFTVLEPSKGIGAHQRWQGLYNHGEMTITKIDESSIMFNILFDDEHIANGQIKLQQTADGIYVHCSLTGEITTPIIGGYLALINEYIIDNSLRLALNNLKTRAQLNHTNQLNQP